MVVYKLNGIDVYFPFDAYPSQLEYMHLLLDCFQQSNNGLLESPTGTGKTLSVLCASLSYLSNVSKNERPLKLFYASRTHSQLNQVARHLKALLRSTFKSLRMCILGSRDQLCINPLVRQKPQGYARVVACRTLVKNGSCNFHRLLTKANNGILNNIPNAIDIEDIIKIGNDHQFCPYYISTTDLLTQSDIVLLPYNYLIDDRIRRLHKIDVQNCIIALDEAHNIEDVCEETCSAQIKLLDFENVLRAPNSSLLGDATSETIVNVMEKVKDCLRKLDVQLKTITTFKTLPGTELTERFIKSNINGGILEYLDQWNPRDDRLSGTLNRLVCFIEAVLTSKNHCISSFCCLRDVDSIR